MRPEPRDLYARPEVLVAEAVDDYGIHTVIDTCLALIEGHDDYDLLAMPLTYLGGAAARGKLDRGELVSRGQDYWPRTWGVRGLGHAWLPYAADGVVAALADPHWRVRESAAKIVLRHGIRDAAPALVALIGDGEPRVQVAAIRASASVGGARHLDALASLGADDRAVGVARSAAVRELRRKVVGPTSG
ncbi:HEAT repeat domain-containing protein [Solicola gregarius]|uniref:HEAT repeat domain-containing protein n=1 Tax=Solicola gregarius TaxID=2908642 RepID=A0AA46THL0_9ACTN|nr:HEAT repeat domain-containing protein [Solicola gregarius]UYM05285.1 HEAT repeat domain-containing protein [Solicola gregarius]